MAKERSSMSERNCFSASFDGRCFQVRKLETGVPEGTHSHTHTHPCSTLKNTRFQFSDMKEAPVEWKEKWKSSLLSVSHKQRACGALTGCRSLSSSETHSTSTKSVGTCFKGVQNGNLHYSCTVKNGKIHLVYSTAKVWLFALQKLKTEVTGYLYFIIYSMQQSLNLALLFLSC